MRDEDQEEEKGMTFACWSRLVGNPLEGKDTRKARSTLETKKVFWVTPSASSLH